MKRIFAVILTAAVLMIGTALPSFADAGDGTSCVSGHWPADVQGRPGGLHKLGATGLYVYHDNSGWHLRVTHTSNSHVTFKGRVTTDGELYGVAKRTERNDRVVFSASAHGVAYRFENYGGIDGIDFRTKCANHLTFSATLNGQTLTARQVFIGSNGHHPRGVPFVIKRTR